MSALSQQTIRHLILNQDMVTNYLDLNEQLQPNGFDLTLKTVEPILTTGKLTKTEKVLPTTTSAELRNGIYRLTNSHPYLVTFNEVFNLPPNVMALVFQRSTLSRMGAAMHTAVWDAGYHGSGQVFLNVSNPMGISIEPETRVAQMVFFELDQMTEELYQGQYQHEGLNDEDSWKIVRGSSFSYGEMDTWDSHWTPVEELTSDKWKHEDYGTEYEGPWPAYNSLKDYDEAPFR